MRIKDVRRRAPQPPESGLAGLAGVPLSYEVEQFLAAARQKDLRHGVYLTDHQRHDLDRVRQQPPQNHAEDDERVTRHHQDHQPFFDLAPVAQADEDADQQRLVGERIEITAQHRSCVELLGQESVQRVGQAGGDEQPEREPDPVRDNEPHDDRHRQHPAKRDQVRHQQMNARPGHWLFWNSGRSGSGPGRRPAPPAVAAAVSSTGGRGCATGAAAGRSAGRAKRRVQAARPRRRSMSCWASARVSWRGSPT